MSPLDIIALPGHPGMFARRVAVDAWRRAGSPPVNSAGRLYALQKYFWDGWRLRKPGFQPADNPDNEWMPLAHVRFVAFDIDPTADRIRRLAAAGFVRPYKFEPWHWELPNVRSYSLVRSIPATASSNITPIIELEHLMFLARNKNDSSKTSRTFLWGPPPMTPEIISDDTAGIYQDAGVRLEELSRDRWLYVYEQAVKRAGKYAPKAGTTINGGPTAEAIALEVIRQMKLPGN